MLLQMIEIRILRHIKPVYEKLYSSNIIYYPVRKRVFRSERLNKQI